MTANKSKLLTQIEDALARDNAKVCANLINIAQIFAKLDERFAGIETKLKRLVAESPPPTFSKSTLANLPSAHAEQLIALLDQRIKTALQREQHALSEATAGVVRNVLREFVDEFKQVRGAVEAKLLQLQTLLAERAPVDPRPN